MRTPRERERVRERDKGEGRSDAARYSVVATRTASVVQSQQKQQASVCWGRIQLGERIRRTRHAK